MIYDLIVIGMGPAGMSAAIYGHRSGLNMLVFEKELPGGLINRTSNVDNYLGFNDILGPDLALKMFEHFKDSKIPYKMTGVNKVTVEGDIKLVHTDNEIYKAKSVIIATGRKTKKLPVDNAEKLEGNGISYCALCDGKLYKGKDVAIVGAGNSAFEEGQYLAKLCNKVYVLNRFGESGVFADDILYNDLKARSNVEIIHNVRIKELILSEDNKLTGVILTDDQKLNVQGLFVFIGYEQASELVEGLGITNDYGYIKVDQYQETEIKGLYACGDITYKKIYQIINAASEGAEAAINANKYIEDLNRKKLNN